MKNDHSNALSWICEQIRRETGYSEEASAGEAEGVLKFAPELRTLLTDWWETGRIDMSYSISGWSIQRIIDTGLTDCVFGAVTWLNGLLTKPEETLADLNDPFISEVNIDDEGKKSIRALLEQDLKDPHLDEQKKAEIQAALAQDAKTSESGV